jgi:hypothetical protein
MKFGVIITDGSVDEQLSMARAAAAAGWGAASGELRERIEAGPPRLDS